MTMDVNILYSIETSIDIFKILIMVRDGLFVNLYENGNIDNTCAERNHT